MTKTIYERTLEEVRLHEAWDAIRSHKKFLTRVRQQTELKQDDDLYPELMRLVLKDIHVYGLREHICPTMRIAPVREYFWSWVGYHIQGDRVLLIREKHNVELCISFDLEEFAKYLLLTDAEYIEGYELQEILNGYSLLLMSKIRNEYPKQVLRKKDFTLDDFACRYTERMRVRMAEILSHYLSIVTRRRLRTSKPIEIIEKMYGMPARDKRVACRWQKYYD